MRSVSIFGATGSVGESAFDLLMRAGGADAFRTIALTGGRNAARLAACCTAASASASSVLVSSFTPSRRDSAGNVVPWISRVSTMIANATKMNRSRG